MSRIAAAKSALRATFSSVGEKQGAYKITRGLLEKYGPKRVINTPIAEAGVAGIGVGAAYHGLQPNFSMQLLRRGILACRAYSSSGKAAAETLAKDGISAEVTNRRLIMPVGTSSITASGRKPNCNLSEK